LSTLEPSTDVEVNIALVEQDQDALCEIETKAIWAATEAKFVPEVAYESKVCADPETSDLRVNRITYL
jgi:hypothetical protein